MKLLVFLTEKFEYRACEPGSPLADETPEPEHDRVESAVVAFIQCEPRDEDRGEAAGAAFIRPLGRRAFVT